MFPRSYNSPALAILVVDDEPFIRTILATTLQEDGHLVGLASNGAEALRKFREKHWDVVLTDRVMPELNGDELSVAIKQISPRMPIVMVTGTRPRIPCAAVDVLVTKPFSRAQLADAITRSLAICARGKYPPEDFSAAA